MKINNKILALLIILVAVLSVSAVSAAEDVDDIAVSDDSVLADPVTYQIEEGASFDEIQAIFNNASDGDIISFAENAVYDFKNNTGSNGFGIEVTSGVTILGNNATITVGKDIAIVNQTNRQGVVIGVGPANHGGLHIYTDTTVTNLNFNMTANPAWYGRAIQINGGENILIENCTFINGAAGVYSQGTKGNVTIKGNKFTGATNESTIGTSSETGTKAINMMAGAGLYVINNEFGEGCLDGVSIASNARNATVSGNEFFKNYYGIFYGGGVEGIICNENAFICNYVSPVSMTKSAGTSELARNIFQLEDNTTAIYIEQFNTAHGYPSETGEITIIDNIFIACEDASAENIIGVEANSNSIDFINPAGFIHVINNTYESGATVFYAYTNESKVIAMNEGAINNGTATNVIVEGNKVLEESPKAVIVGEDATIQTKSRNQFQILLKDENNMILANKTVTFTINGVSYNRTTDENGKAGLNINLNMGDYNMTVSYTDDEGNTVEETYVVTAVQAKTEIVSNITNITERGQVFTAKLVDSFGVGLANQAVSFHINGVKYYRTTDATGEFSIAIRLDVSGYYNMFMSFDGTYEYTAATGGSQINVLY